MTVVELEAVVDWLQLHLQEFLIDDWNVPVGYREGDELTKALRVFFEGEK